MQYQLKKIEKKHDLNHTKKLKNVKYRHFRNKAQLLIGALLRVYPNLSLCSMLIWQIDKCLDESINIKGHLHSQQHI